MKKTLLIAILIVAAGWLGGCSAVYEEHRSHRHARHVIVPPPPVEVVQVRPHYPTPRPHRRSHRPPSPYPWR